MDVHIKVPFNTNRPSEALAEAAFKEHVHDGFLGTLLA
jgi:hypothetical protein